MRRGAAGTSHDFQLEEQPPCCSFKVGLYINKNIFYLKKIKIKNCNLTKVMFLQKQMYSCRLVVYINIISLDCIV